MTAVCESALAPRAEQDAPGPPHGHSLGDIFLLFSGALGLYLSAFKREILPARFFYDSDRIISFINLRAVPSADGSYAGTADIYRLLGLHSHETTVALVTFLIYLLAVVQGSGIRRVKPPLRYYVLASVAILLGAIFIAGYTKEVPVVIVMALFLSVSRRRGGMVLLGVAVILYAMFVREYWYITLAIYIVSRVAVRKTRLSLLTPLVIILTVATLTIIFDNILHVTLTYYRYSVVESFSVNPSSVITDPLPPGGFLHDAINGSISIVKMVFPYPLISASPTKLVTFFVTSILWLTYFTRLPRIDREQGEWRSSLSRAASFLLAYVLTLSVFEPDYGSYLRHLTAILPVMVFLLVRSYRTQAVS